MEKIFIRIDIGKEIEMESKVKSKINLKVILTIITILVVGLVGFLFVYFAKATTDGTIIIKIENENGEVLSEKEVNFLKGDSLVDLVNKEYNGQIEYSNGDYGMYLTKIHEIREVREQTYMLYISILKNGEYSEFGISNLPFEDGDIITFKLVRYDFE